MIEDLKNKQWPTSPLKADDLDGESVVDFLKSRAKYEKSAFVDEGHVEVRVLGPSAFASPIPPDECAISSLVCYSSGKIYGGTSGKNAHLFFYDPSPDADTVVDIGIVTQNAAITSLVAEKQGRIYGSTDGKDADGVLFCYEPCEVLMEKMDFDEKGVREIFDTPVEDQVFHSIVDPCHSKGEIKILTVPVPGEGISSLVLDDTRNIICGLTSKSGTFFAYDTVENKVCYSSRVKNMGLHSQRLVMDGQGYVYGAGEWGQIFRYDNDKQNMEKLDIYASSLKGREIYNQVQAWAYDDITGLIYGGTVDGIVFIFDPATCDMTCLGKPLDQAGICTLTVANDGNIYGIGGDTGCSHLFVYDTTTRELRDLGCLLARVERPWYGYEFASSVTGKDGRIYFGESDRISHLFMYFPPVRRMSFGEPRCSP